MADDASTAITPPRTPAKTNVTADELQRHRQELGRLGAFFGSRENAAVFVVGITALTGMFGLVIIMLVGRKEDFSSDGLKVLGGIVSSAVSFLAGLSTKGEISRRNSR